MGDQGVEAIGEIQDLGVTAALGHGLEGKGAEGHRADTAAVWHEQGRGPEHTVYPHKVLLQTLRGGLMATGVKFLWLLCLKTI